MNGLPKPLQATHCAKTINSLQETPHRFCPVQQQPKVHNLCLLDDKRKAPSLCRSPEGLLAALAPPSSSFLEWDTLLGVVVSVVSKQVPISNRCLLQLRSVCLLHDEDLVKSYLHTRLSLFALQSCIPRTQFFLTLNTTFQQQVSEWIQSTSHKLRVVRFSAPRDLNRLARAQYYSISQTDNSNLNFQLTFFLLLCLRKVDALDRYWNVVPQSRN